MSFGEDWLGWTIFVFIIVTIIIIVIKVFIEYPGLTGLKCVYKEELEDSMDDDDVYSGMLDDKRKKLKVCQDRDIPSVQSKKRCESDKVAVKLNEKERKMKEATVMLDEETGKENEDHDSIIMEKKISFDITCEKNPTKPEIKKTIATIELSKPGPSEQFISTKHAVYRQC